MGGGEDPKQNLRPPGPALRASDGGKQPGGELSLLSLGQEPCGPGVGAPLLGGDRLCGPTQSKSRLIKHLLFLYRIETNAMPGLNILLEQPAHGPALSQVFVLPA